MSHLYKVLLINNDFQEWVKVPSPFYHQINVVGQVEKAQLFRSEIEKALESQWDKMKKWRYAEFVVVKVTYLGYTAETTESNRLSVMFL